MVRNSPLLKHSSPVTYTKDRTLCLNDSHHQTTGQAASIYKLLSIVSPGIHDLVAMNIPISQGFYLPLLQRLALKP